MLQRQEFIRLVHQGRHPITELCITFGISEKTGHKWLARFARDGFTGLADRSHVPHSPPHQLSATVRRSVMCLREKHPSWGARKLRASVMRSSPEITWPAASTIGELLRREGLVRPRRRRRSREQLGAPLDLGRTVANSPNEMWTTDFKGEFRLGPGPYCYPLTEMDAHRRFLIGCTALLSTAQVPVQIVFTRLFQRYGLPRVIKSDNGVPFANPNALCRLSTLAVWWIRLGIRPERIEPGHPQQNGKHERLHKTLKAEATRPPGSTLREQQDRFDRFRREYNAERPHEALSQTPPAGCYVPSARQFPGKLPALEYPSHAEVRRVSANGTLAWKGRYLWLTKTLGNQDVSFEETETDIWNVSFGPLVLGTYHPPSNTFIQESYWKPPLAE
jgi:putative transposase